ncbi:unnamed protein product [Toxocara canis]|uniref:START domain-containing protein n=1 Tax=Toxocara canis TaxID=6265 RepID=A0A183VCS7_TOXCA|nr:unnamed protein product [Toxocara canis]
MYCDLGTSSKFMCAAGTKVELPCDKPLNIKNIRKALAFIFDSLNKKEERWREMCTSWDIENVQITHLEHENGLLPTAYRVLVRFHAVDKPYSVLVKVQITHLEHENGLLPTAYRVLVRFHAVDKPYSVLVKMGLRNAPIVKLEHLLWVLLGLQMLANSHGKLLWSMQAIAKAPLLEIAKTHIMRRHNSFAEARFKKEFDAIIGLKNGPLREVLYDSA